MQASRITALAMLIVFGTGVVWGAYWIPVRSLDAQGIGGAWGTVAITGAAVLLLLPAAIARRRSLASAGTVALVAVALGGAAFAFYSVAFNYGRVAICILLFYLTPVWSTLIARYVMGWPTPPLRLFAIGVGLLGLITMLAATGGMPVPRTPGEWMGLASGLLWSIGTTGIRAKPALRPAEAAFVFAVGALLAALLLTLFLGGWPTSVDAPLRALGTAISAGALWWGLSIAALMWATVRLDPARVGILLMSEVVVGATSAALLAGEALHPVEIAGGALVLCAGVLEVWPVRGSVR